jgi:hypothetical protein
MRKATLVIATALGLLPAIARAQLQEMRQTIFGMD